MPRGSSQQPGPPCAASFYWLLRCASGHTSPGLGSCINSLSAISRIFSAALSTAVANLGGQGEVCDVKEMVPSVSSKAATLPCLSGESESQGMTAQSTLSAPRLHPGTRELKGSWPELAIVRGSPAAPIAVGPRSLPVQGC